MGVVHDDKTGGGGRTGGAKQRKQDREQNPSFHTRLDGLGARLLQVSDLKGGRPSIDGLNEVCE
jgi:hypothetical protein